MKWIIVILARLLAGCAATTSNVVSPTKYDKPRCDQIQRVIDSSENSLCRRKLDDVAKMLMLEGVPHDAGYSNLHGIECRIYHFRGFCLYLFLQRLPKGHQPEDLEAFLEPDPKDETSFDRWLYDRPPLISIDGISNPKKRMRLYWKEWHERWKELQRKSDEMESAASERQKLK